MLAGKMMRWPCKEDCGCESVSSGWRQSVSCWRPEVYVCRTYVGNKCAGQAFKIVSRLQHRRRLRSAGLCFLPAGFVFHRFRHIVNDTNYKERGIFYG